MSEWTYTQRNDIIARVRDIQNDTKSTQRQMTEAFTKVATALEKLTEEIKALRADMNPKLDKQKLPAPQQGGTAP